MLSRDVGADSAIAEELAVGAESRLAAEEISAIGIF
jgi:hypothetical protein